ncbi:hypothetical protein KIN20_022453 [Parelaphostrongylus tenuis]|uniref:Uncharacterized protein n=1 Tax=Parelaphostrongylus tenuis TaxID=148309 RepID=A0AAD5MVJ2_PARTN|nr:hypothetical protein KIN20_022453 [Parelaphostrongylus tenuis]
MTCGPPPTVQTLPNPVQIKRTTPLMGTAADTLREAAVDVQSEQQPVNLVYQVIDSKHSFFEIILKADNGLLNELWLTIGQQADRSTQPTSISGNSALIEIVAFNVTRLLLFESTVHVVDVSEMAHRKETQLDLYFTMPPLVNSINSDVSTSD